MKKIVLSVLILFPIFLFTACNGHSIELQNELVIEAVGIDKDKGDDLILTVQTLNTEDYPTNGEGAASGKISSVHTVTGKSVNEALNNLSLITGKDPIYSHNRMVIIGESIYKNYDISEYIDFFIRSCQSRDDLFIVAAEGKAGEIAGVEMGEGKLPAKIAEEIVLSGKRNGLCTAVRIFEYMNMYSNPARCEYMPILRAKENNEDQGSNSEKGGKEADNALESAGTLITRNGKYALTLNAEETKMLTFFTEDISDSILEGDFENTRFSLRILDSKVKIKPETVSETPKITVCLTCYCAITEMEYKRTGTTTEDVNKITETAKKDLIKNMDQLLRKTAIDHGYDILNLYSKFLKKETDYFKRHIEHEDELIKAENWSNSLRELEIEYDIKVNIHRPGQDVFRA